MRAAVSTAVVALALLLSGCGDKGGSDGTASTGKPAAAVPAPNGGDWTEIVEQTAEGGYRMGNPNAPVKLLEFASISCAHCAEFAEAGSAALRDKYVRSGRVSWEYRPFMIFPTDPGVFSLLRCRGPQTFFPLTEQLYADQRNWLNKLQSMTPAQQQQLAAMPAQQQIAGLVQMTGVDRFFQQRGMPAGQIASCLADQQSVQQLAAMTETATKQHNVTGTPTFFINGGQADVGGPPYWGQLEPQLRSALGE